MGNYSGRMSRKLVDNVGAIRDLSGTLQDEHDESEIDRLSGSEYDESECDGSECDGSECDESECDESEYDESERKRQANLDAYYKDVYFQAYGNPELNVTLEQLRPQKAEIRKRIAFTDLPGEVRNSIYRKALVIASPINGIATKIPAIWILAATKQIHEEASSILYGENTFTFGAVVDWEVPELLLAGFPDFVNWPTPRYTPFLTKLHLKFAFGGGYPWDLVVPESLLSGIQAMRDAYDYVWDVLDITFDFSEADLTPLMFTTAWIMFRFFQRITHPACKVVVAENTPSLVKWCVKYAMRGRDIRASLSAERQKAFQEAETIANDSYSRNKYICFTYLSRRLLWGEPSRTTFGPSFPRPPPPFFTLRRPFRQLLVSSGSITAPPMSLSQQSALTRLYSDMLEGVRTPSHESAQSLVMRDNELRTLAYLDFEGLPEAKQLVMKDQPELQTYFALQRYADRITTDKKLEKESTQTDA